MASHLQTSPIGPNVTRTDRFGRITSTGPTDQKDRVDVQAVEFIRMQKEGEWDLLHNLLGGTRRMREKGGIDLLPRHEREQSKNWRRRLDRSFLFNGLRDTVEKLSAKPFAKPPTAKDIDKLPEQLVEIWDDVDKTGRNLASLAKKMFADAQVHGLTHLLVDFPQMPGGLSRAEERIIGARPLFIHVKAEQLFAWRFAPDLELEQVRIRETQIIADGDFGDREVNFIRVINRQTWELHKEVKDKEGRTKFVFDSGGTHSFNGVPVVTYYIAQTGKMTARPPFLDLAWLNLAHWQSASDQRNILRVTRVAVLFGSGFSEEEKKAGLIVSTHNAIFAESENAQLGYVEHTGKAIEAGQDDLDKLEFQMEMLGLQPIIKRVGEEKATGLAINEAKTQAAIQSWIQDLEMALVQAYKFAARWTKTELPENFDIDIFSEFSIAIKSKDDIDQLIKVWMADGIDHRVFLNELKRRALLAESVEVESVIEALSGGEVPPAEVGLQGEENEPQRTEVS